MPSTLDISPKLALALSAKRQRSGVLSLLVSKIDTPLGTITFELGEVAVYSWDTALLRIHDLHLRAIGSKGVVEEADGLDATKAVSLFRIAVSALICQLEMSPPEHSLALLKRVVSVATALGTSDGLESIFLTSFSLGLSVEGGDADAQDALESWSSIGWPTAPGGGLRFGGAFDRALGFLRFEAKDLREFERSVTRGSLQAQLRSNDLRWAMSGSDCRELGKIYGILGGVIAGGGLGGGPVGAGVGAVAGEKIGEAMGTIFCTKDGSGNGGADKDDDAGAAKKDPDGNGVPDDDDDDVEEGNAGCILPDMGDYVVADPYGSFAVRRIDAAVPFGKGLRTLIVQSGGSTFLSGTPTAALGSDGRLALSSGGFLSASPSVQQSLSRYSKGVFKSVWTRNSAPQESSKLLSAANPSASAATRTFGIEFYPTPVVESPIAPSRPGEPIVADLAAGASYHVVTTTNLVTVTDADGNDVPIEITERSIYFSEGSALAVIFGSPVTGDRADRLLQNPSLLATLERGIPSNFTPSKGRVLAGKAASAPKRS